MDHQSANQNNNNPAPKPVSLMRPDFSERSEMVQEIVSRKPDFLERWTLLIFLLLILGLLAGTWFIKYPDTVPGGAILTSENAPKEIISKQGGKLTLLLVQNNDNVSRGQILGWLESNASTGEVIELSEKLTRGMRTLQQQDSVSIPSLFSKPFTRLGELQAPFQVFTAALQQYSDYMSNGFYHRKKNFLYADISTLNSIKSKTDTQRTLTTKDSELARKSFEMNEKLYKEKVISLEEYRQAQSKLISNQKQLPQADVNILSQQSQIRDKEKEINQLNHDILQQQIIFEQALYTMKSAVDDWLRQYTIQSPSDGRIVFTLPIQQDHFIEPGKLLGYVNPADSKYYVELRLSQNNFGKIDSGMKVQIRFDAYPYQEFGFVTGELSYISKVAVDSGFLGTIKLTNGLNTNHRKTIPFKDGLKGTALVVTRDMRLAERLYYAVTNSINMNN